MNKTIRLFGALFVLAAFLSSCNKGPGEGGTGTIQGLVKLVHHPDDDFSLTPDTMAAAKTDVFLVYGDDVYFNDDVETGADGMYRFEYLLPGSYTVYSYSTLPSGEKVAVGETVTLVYLQARRRIDGQCHLLAERIQCQRAGKAGGEHEL